jgi:hypothetical protein
MGAAGVTVQRSGTTVSYSINSGQSSQCPEPLPLSSPSARLSVGIYGPTAERVETLVITRQ